MDPERLSASEMIASGAPFHIYRTQLAESYPLHWHDCYEIALILRGSGLHTVNGRPQPLAPGTLFLLTPVDFHQLAPAPGEALDLYNAVFLGNFLDAELRQWLFTGLDYHHFVLPPSLAERIRQEFEQTLAEYQGQGLGRERLMRSGLEKILLEVARHVRGNPDLDRAGHSAVHNALLYLQHHFRAPLTLAEVAGQARMAPTYFSQAFHKATGTQFQKYLSDLRLRFAASLLLADAALPVTEICFASGFGNMAHFGRSFHAKYGLSPSRYRQQASEGALPLVSPDATDEMQAAKDPYRRDAESAKNL
jgi:AraC-like DNA-binding protein